MGIENKNSAFALSDSKLKPRNLIILKMTHLTKSNLQLGSSANPLLTTHNQETHPVMHSAVLATIDLRPDLTSNQILQMKPLKRRHGIETSLINNRCLSGTTLDYKMRPMKLTNKYLEETPYLHAHTKSNLHSKIHCLNSMKLTNKLLQESKFLAPGNTSDRATHEVEVSELEDFNFDARTDFWQMSEEMPDYQSVQLEDQLEQISFQLSNSAEESPMEKVLASNLKTKVAFVHAVSASLISAPNLNDRSNAVRQTLLEHAKTVVQVDPEFVLKMALYARLELNIRSTANLLLAFAAHEGTCRPFVEKYYGTIIRLPSDWLEVANLYQTFFENQISPLPSVLRRAMVSRFSSFDEYQLAKYNKEKTIKKKNKKAEKIRCLKNSSREPTYADVVQGDMKKSTDDKVRQALTLKQLIRLLHISQPADHVMSIIGKKYPSNLIEFWASGLQGMWAEERAGKRMKLSIPETWETQLSLKGNKAATWHELLDNKKLPFMAMLRNLRNLILANISEKHHVQVLGILKNEKAVIKSRQFPFRFLSAFDVLSQLEETMNESNKGIKERQQIKLKGRQQIKPKWTKKNKRISSEHLPIIQRYQKALNKSMEIATVHNIPPIKGTSIIFCSLGFFSKKMCPTAKKFGKLRSVSETALLLGLMCSYCCEANQLIVFGDDNAFQVETKFKDPILTQVEKILKQINELGVKQGKGQRPADYLDDFLKNKKQMDNLIILTDSNDDLYFESFLHKYRILVNPHLLFVSVELKCRETRVQPAYLQMHPNDVFLSGFSDQLFRFIAERGGTQQLQHLDNIDKMYKLVTKARNLPEHKNEIKPLYSPLIRKPKWRSVRVFISSTFRDMHGERDILVRYIFPELRSKAISLCLDVHDVDLRWGITEQEADENRTMEICLQEAACCDLFLGLLGERYGTEVHSEQIPDSDEFLWAKQYPTGTSITELEFHIGALKRLDGVKQKALICIRENSFYNDVPEKWKSDFSSESEENKGKLNKLKGKIRSSELELIDGYPCAWGGEISGKPIVSELDELGKTILSKLWKQLQELYPNEDEEMDVDSENQITQAFNLSHENFAHQRAKTFVRRKHLVEQCTKIILNDENKLITVTGKPGCGKSSFMARIFHDLKQMSLEVIPYFVGATPDSNSFNHLVSHIGNEINGRLVGSFMQNQKLVYDELLLNQLLQASSNLTRRLLLLIDGLDEISKDLTWLPDPIPENICIICAVADNSLTFKTLVKRDSVVIRLVPLLPSDRAELVRSFLAPHRKVLSESTFKNQMRPLISRIDSGRPLFLRLACDEIRLHSAFEQLTDVLHQLPSTISGLLKQMLLQMEKEHGKKCISVAFAFITSSTNGLLEEELYFVLNLYCYFLNHQRYNWQEIIKASFDRVKMVPRSSFAKLLQSLRTFLQVSTHSSSTTLVVTHQEISVAIRNHCKQFEDINMVNMFLAANCYAEADPHYDLTWSGKNPRAFTNIIHYLLAAKYREKAEQFLTDMRFLRAKAALGLANELLQDYVAVQKFIEENGISSQFSHSSVQFEEFSNFVTRHSHVLIENPQMILQQALNDPTVSVVCKKAEKIFREDGGALTVLRWLNKPEEGFGCTFIHPLFEFPTCAAVSACETLAAIGMKNGFVEILNLSLMKATQILTAHSNPVSSVCFVDSNRLCSTSVDGTLSLWDLKSGSRLISTKGHERQVSACCYHVESKSLISVGWDCAIRVWNLKSGQELSVRKEKSPINSCACHPHRNIVAIGSWDNTVRVWDLVSLERIAILRGHVSSVTSVIYSKCGNYIASASLDGQVILWSSSYGFKITSFQAHSLRINQVCLNNSATVLCSVADDHSVKVWSDLFAESSFLTVPQTEGTIVAMSSRASTKSVVAAWSDSTLIKMNCETNDIVFSVKPSFCEVTTLFCGENFDVVGYFNGEIMILNTETGHLLQSLQGHTDPVTCITERDNDVISATASGVLGIHHYNTAAKTTVLKVAYTMNAHLAQITGLSIHPKRKLCASVSRDGALKVWKFWEGCINFQASVENCHSDWVTCCKWLVKNCLSFVVTGSNDNWITLWEYGGDELSEIRTIGCLTSTVNFIDIWDQCIVSASSNGNVKLFTETGKEIVSVDVGKKNHFCSLYISKPSEITDWYEEVLAEETDGGNDQTWPSGSLVSAIKSTVQLTQFFSQNKPKTLSGHADATTAVAIVREGNILSCSLDKSLRLWAPPRSVNDVKTRGTAAEITAITGSKNHKWTVTGHRNGAIAIWENETQSVVDTLQAHSNTINAICFINWDIFVTASNDGYVFSWMIDEKGQIMKKKKMDQFTVPTLCLAYCPAHLGLIMGGWCGAHVIVDKNGSKQITNDSKRDEWIVQAAFTESNDLCLLDANRHLFVFVWVLTSDAKMLFCAHKMDCIEDDYFGIPNSLELASGKLCFVGFSDGHLTRVDMESKTTVLYSQMHKGSIKCAIDKKRNLLVTASTDRYVIIWNLNDATEVLSQSFLQKNKNGGMHHICIEVDNIDAAMEDMKKQKVRCLSEKPTIGAHGKPVVFLHPKDCDGVLIELEQA